VVVQVGATVRMSFLVPADGVAGEGLFGECVYVSVFVLFGVVMGECVCVFVASLLGERTGSAAVRLMGLSDRGPGRHIPLCWSRPI
jgi:hypothetical protein